MRRRLRLLAFYAAFTSVTGLGACSGNFLAAPVAADPDLDAATPEDAPPAEVSPPSAGTTASQPPTPGEPVQRDPEERGASGASAVSENDTRSAPRIYGVTLDALDPLEQIVESLAKLSRRPTTRIVFDPAIAAADYLAPVQQIHGVSWVMGEVVDSVLVSGMSVDAYAARTSALLDALHAQVDIWEIGNEVNGEWLGDSAQVRAKIISAYAAVTARGKPTALTLYYNEGCSQKPENAMFGWADANVPGELKLGLDYVFISFYDDHCKIAEPDWNLVFARLATMFPHSLLGFGETGTRQLASKEQYIKHFYGLEVDQPAFVGGYFWWYYREDMLPYTKALWSVLNQSIEMSPP
jgi:hypothetical protein